MNYKISILLLVYVTVLGSCAPKIKTVDDARNVAQAQGYACMADSLLAPSTVHPWDSTIATIATNSGGNVAPTYQFGDFAGTSDSYSRGLAFDPALNLLIVTAEDSNAIKMYTRVAGSNGVLNTAPTRIISGSNTQLATPLGVSVYNGEIYVFNLGTNTGYAHNWISSITRLTQET